MDYSVRLKRQYKCRVVQVVIFLQQTDDEIAYTEQYVDDTTIHRYRAIRMWEQDSSLFLNSLALLPLVPLCQTDSPQTLLSQVAEEVAKISNREIRENTAAYTEILAGLRFEKNLIRQLLSEDIMQESVIYQDILQKGEQRGEFRFLNRMLNRRFGDIDSSIIERIKVLSTEQLEALGEESYSFTNVSDVVAWLEENVSNS